MSIKLHKNSVVVREANTAAGRQGCLVQMMKTPAGEYFIRRKQHQNNIVLYNDNYRLVDDVGFSDNRKFDETSIAVVFERLVGGMHAADAFIVKKDESTPKVEFKWTRSPEEHKYTSTGVKFWRHAEQMLSYKGAIGSSIISTHVSPEGSCNLKCPYCSVTYRDTHSRIELPRIKQYVSDLKSRGLKAVILTGGGEPTLYPDFNELVTWIKHDMGLSVALITNGTMQTKISKEAMRCFSWIRVSINMFDGWTSKISLDVAAIDPSCIIGCSFVNTAEHESADASTNDTLTTFRQIAGVASKLEARYVRIIPNAILKTENLMQEHATIKQALRELGDPRFFQQFKMYGAPKANLCHQAYFRPYLSEEPFHATGVPGSVYPCDSVVVNNGLAYFAKQYQVCAPEDVLGFMDGKIQMQFTPCVDCTGCVFVHNNDMLDDWVNGKVDRFSEFPDPLTHEEFV